MITIDLSNVDMSLPKKKKSKTSKFFRRNVYAANEINDLDV